MKGIGWVTRGHVAGRCCLSLGGDEWDKKHQGGTELVSFCWREEGGCWVIDGCCSAGKQWEER